MLALIGIPCVVTSSARWFRLFEVHSKGDPGSSCVSPSTSLRKAGTRSGEISGISLRRGERHLALQWCDAEL